MTPSVAGGAPAGGADPEQLARSRLFMTAARDLLQRPAEKAETAALFAAEAARLSLRDEAQLGAAVPLLRQALRHLTGTPLRIHDRIDAAGNAEAISSITLSADGSLIACGTTGGLVYLWHVSRDGAARQERLLVTETVASPQPVHEPVDEVQLLFHDHWLVVVTASGKVRALDTSKGLADLDVPADWQPYEGIAASPDGALVGIRRPEANAVDVWTLKDGAPRKVWSYTDPKFPIHAMSFSADGARVLLTHDATDVRVLEAATGKVIRSLSLPVPDPPAPRSGRSFFAVNLGQPSFRGDISPNGLVLFMQETQLVQHVATRPDGLEEVVEAPSVETGTWDLSGAQPVALSSCLPEVTRSPLAQLAFSRNSWLAVTSGRRLLLQELSNLRDITRMRCYKQERESGPDFTGVSFDRGGRLAVGTSDGFVELRRLGDAASMAQPLVIPGFPGAVVPELARGEPRLLMYSSTGGRHGQLIRVCDLDRDCQPHEPAAGAGADSLLALARRLLGRNLTVEEWQAVLPAVPYERTFDDISDAPLMRSLVSQAGHEAAAGDPSKALAALQRALDAARSSGNPHALAGLARAALELQMYDPAAAAADALLQLWPADLAALWYRGQARALKGDPAAVEDLKAYIAWQRARKVPRATFQWEENAIQLLRKGVTPVPRN